jgi:hypothetical protein
MREREFTVLADEFSLGATTYPGLSYLDRTIQACNSVLQSAELVAGPSLGRHKRAAVFSIK